MFPGLSYRGSKSSDLPPTSLPPQQPDPRAGRHDARAEEDAAAPNCKWVMKGCAQQIENMSGTGNFFFFAAFFLNPISHQPGYRHHVIHCLPSLQVLDGKGEIYRHSEGRLTCHKKVCISCTVSVCCAVRGEVGGEEEVLPDAQPGASSRPPVCGLLQTGDITPRAGEDVCY